MRPRAQGGYLVPNHSGIGLPCAIIHHGHMVVSDGSSGHADSIQSVENSSAWPGAVLSRFMVESLGSYNILIGFIGSDRLRTRNHRKQYKFTNTFGMMKGRLWI